MRNDQARPGAIERERVGVSGDVLGVTVEVDDLEGDVLEATIALHQ